MAKTQEPPLKVGVGLMGKARRIEGLRDANLRQHFTMELHANLLAVDLFNVAGDPQVMYFAPATGAHTTEEATK